MECGICLHPKTVRECLGCGKPLCKNCVRFLEKEEFRFHPRPPKLFQHRQFCVDCFDRDVEPELAKYREVAARAEDVVIVRKSYRGFLPVVQKAKTLTEVKRHVDKGDAIEHLSFLAAWAGYDAITELETEGKKIRNHAWEKTEWSARALPVKLDRTRFRPESLED